VCLERQSRADDSGHSTPVVRVPALVFLPFAGRSASLRGYLEQMAKIPRLAPRLA
jgi:hypothetical protein